MKVFKIALMTWVIILAVLLSFSLEISFAQPGSSPPNEGTLIKAKDGPKVYVIRNGKKLWIPSPKALTALHGKTNKDIKKVSGQELESIPTNYSILTIQPYPKK